MATRQRQHFAAALVTVVALCGSSTAEAETPEITLYTMGPGADPFTAFGHAALCMRDDKYPGGLCYNYGTADFTKPVTLVLDVLEGDAIFFVSTWKSRRMVRLYRREDRTIFKQVLALDPAAASAARTALAHDARRENRSYTYNHIFDNCSTRPRDHIDRASGGRLSELEGHELDVTFRQLVRRGLSHSPVLSTASEIFLGRALDRPPTGYEAMFLPKVLRETVARDLGSKPQVVFMPEHPITAGYPLVGQRWLWTIAILLGGLGASLSVFGHRTGFARVGRGLPALLTSLVGVLLFGLMIISPSPELRVNELAFVLMPTDLILLSDGRLLRPYLTLRAAILAVVGLCALLGVFVQPLWASWTLVSVTVGAALLGTWARDRFNEGNQGPATHSTGQ